MAQAIYHADDLPAGGVAAYAAFARDHLGAVEDAIAGLGAAGGGLVIVLGRAGDDEDDWRRTLARDLARAHAPVRVNVIAADQDAARDSLLDYLNNANAVTGHYLKGS